MTHADTRELLGAFAVHAVEDHERVEVERHITGCDECRRELDEHVETLAMINPDPDVEPAAETWTRIAAAITSSAVAKGQVPSASATSEETGKVVSLRERRQRRSWVVSPWLSAVAAIVIVTMGVGLVLQAQRIDTLENADPVAAAVSDVVNDPTAIQATLTNEGSAASVDIVLAADGTGFVTANTLAQLPADRTYQLWAVVNGEVLSAAVLGSEPGVVPFRIDPEGLEAFAVTEEIAGGVAVSENDPTALWVQEA